MTPPLSRALGLGFALMIELGIILTLIMGANFAAAFIGGPVMIVGVDTSVAEGGPPSWSNPRARDRISHPAGLSALLVGPCRRKTSGKVLEST